MRRLLATIALALAVAIPAGAQERGGPTADDVHEMERLRFDFGPLRPGRNGDKTAPDAANFDEARVGNLVPPPLFETEIDGTRQGWMERRKHLQQLVEDNWTGHIPDSVADFRIVWHKQKSGKLLNRRYDEEQWVGQIIGKDGAMGPVIDATITSSRNAQGAPAFIEYTYIWPPGFSLGGNGPAPPSTRQMALDRGWAHVAYRVQLLQADTAAQMEQGVIGLARWPRERHDWGALRAWGWGASRLREELAKDARIDGSRITLGGHSRFGKAVLVAAAFDHEFADALVSSSGAGGAKLMRRDFGEHWNNMAGSYAFHWYTPQVMEYAGHKSVADLPVDAHTLIALRAPLPLFVSSGLAEKGDDWVDPKGMFVATALARPAWRVFGAEVFESDGETMPEVLKGHTETPLAFYQHDQGHVMWAAMEDFLDHAEANWGR
ncbi:MAG TPA: hypothetical protein VLA37_05725 [Sphingomonadaceae bacterium]|nr:hypothetical protein [Sphingomonadaceae bacterium]